MLRTLLYTCLLSVSFITIASDDANLFQTCIACHGVSGEGNSSIGAPAIAGLDEKYVARQLRNFKSGIRGSAEGDSYGALMQSSVSVLTDTKINTLSKFVAAMPIQPLAQPINGDTQKGKTRYNGNCGACHGAAGEGNPSLNAPRLNNQDVAYLTRQLEHFKTKRRGQHSADKFGRQMAMMATTVPNDQALHDVLSYLQQAAKGTSK